MAQVPRSSLKERQMSGYWGRGSDREFLIPDLGQGGLIPKMYKSQMGNCAASISIRGPVSMNLLYRFSSGRSGTILQL